MRTRQLLLLVTVVQLLMQLFVFRHWALSRRTENNGPVVALLTMITTVGNLLNREYGLYSPTASRIMAALATRPTVQAVYM
jgi:hypothetical protein